MHQNALTKYKNEGTKTEKRAKTYEFHCTTSAFNNQIGHVANQVSSEAEVEEHIKDDEDHLGGVDCMHVPVSNGGHGGYGPVEG